MPADPPRAALHAYGLEAESFTPLTGGVINEVWRIEDSDLAFVLKQYAALDITRVRQSIAVQQAAQSQGVPVPTIVPNRFGQPVTVVDGRAHVLSPFMAGKLYEPGAIPEAASRHMGEVLGHLHAALTEMKPGRTPSLPSPSEIEAQLRSLLAISLSRKDDPIDEIAAGILEAKLDLLSGIDRVPALEAQWTHGDFEWRNVLFDDAEQVAAVIDFDDAAYYHPARDVMRCIALSFPALEPGVDEYFAGYTSVRHLTTDEARDYVEFYRYISTFRVWPIIARYRQQEYYKPEWSALIQPLIAWDWDLLAHRLSDVAANGVRG
jgi:homoserine kinase type II